MFRSEHFIISYIMRLLKLINSDTADSGGNEINEIIPCFSEKTRQFLCLLKTYKLKLNMLACTAKNGNFQGLFFKGDNLC